MNDRSINNAITDSISATKDPCYIHQQDNHHPLVLQHKQQQSASSGGVQSGEPLSRGVKAPPEAGLPASGGDGIPGAINSPQMENLSQGVKAPPKAHIPALGGDGILGTTDYPDTGDFTALLGKKYLIYRKEIANWKLSAAKYYQQLSLRVLDCQKQASRTCRSPAGASRTGRLPVLDVVLPHTKGQFQ